MVTLDEVSKALPDLHVATVMNDYRCSIRSMNYGQPLAAAAPRSRVRRDIEGLAASITGATKNKT
jgi:Flp pilus assembly CpaE family ATPase